jgi:hypothetical protein
LFTPLAVMPEAPRGAPRSGERALLAAIVKDAIDIVRGGKVWLYARVTRDDAAAARRWIVEGDIGAITFNACCQWLDLGRAVHQAAILGRGRGWSRGSETASPHSRPEHLAAAR